MVHNTNDKLTNEDLVLLKQLIVKYGRGTITTICNQYDAEIWEKLHKQ